MSDVCDSYIKNSYLRGAAIGIVILVYSYFLLIIFSDKLIALGLLAIVLSYYLAGYYCGKHWAELSWRWGFWLTIPLLTVILLGHLRFVIETKTFGEPLGSIISYFILFVASSYGGYRGANNLDLEI